MNYILLIENDTLLLDNLIELLELEGYKVKGASTVEDAFSVIKNLKPSVIICDEYSLTGEIKQLFELLSSETTKNTSIIILNSFEETRKFKDADIYLKMPFQEDELLSSLDYLAGIQKI